MLCAVLACTESGLVRRVLLNGRTMPAPRSHFIMVALSSECTLVRACSYFLLSLQAVAGCVEDFFSFFMGGRIGVPTTKTKSPSCCVMKKGGLSHGGSQIMFGKLADDTLCNDAFLITHDSLDCRAAVFTGEVPSPREGAAACMLGESTLFLWGGFGEDGFLADGYILDVDTLHWTAVSLSPFLPEGKQPQPRFLHSAICVPSGEVPPSSSTTSFFTCPCPSANDG